MFPTAKLYAFTLAAFALIILPGPSVLFIIGRSVSLGKGASLAAALRYAV